jgi:arylformamidase
MKIYDISMTIHQDMQVYKNKESKKPIFTNMSNHISGKVYETKIELDVHCGTHLDAPLHMIKDGATIESIPLESLIGPARVIDLTEVQESIGQKELEPFAIQKNEWILLKTRNSLSEQFDFDFVYLNASGAHYLQQIGIKGIGTDGLGIERAQADYITHKTLLANNIAIVEGLRLKDVHEGVYEMIIAPLKLTGIDAAPARAFLIAK